MFWLRIQNMFLLEITETSCMQPPLTWMQMSLMVTHVAAKNWSYLLGSAIHYPQKIGGVDGRLWDSF
uniref:Putative secreted protein n=1 Tax=Anopheles darlingi TaxID=43151 RepID=A0A2M4DC87_ANODA